ncbi:hypothetical protein Hanom_Chr05g00451921 [Helianthus anomalus]
MSSSYPGRHMPLPRLEPGTSWKRWVSGANWPTPKFWYMSVTIICWSLNTFGAIQKVTKPLQIDTFKKSQNGLLVNCHDPLNHYLVTTTTPNRCD